MVKKIILLFIFTLTTATICNSQNNHEKSATKFEPVHFEREHSVLIQADADKAFNILGPRGSRLISKKKVNFLYGNENDLDRAIFRIEGRDAFYVVAKYDKKARIYRTTILMPENELWLNEYEIESKANGYSKLTVRWRITGYNDSSNEAINGFLDHDKKENSFIKGVERLGNTLEQFLKK